MSRAIATSDGFDDAFPRLYTGALRLALRMLGDRAGAEDVAAEAMARTYASWHKVRHLSYLDAWVLRTTSNLALDALRRRGSGHRALGRMVIRRAVEGDTDGAGRRVAAASRAAA
jgi:DNA-directed RNA polymerase specialized sigma24 family protein